VAREYPHRPIVGVGLVILRGDAVLLARRGKPPRAGDWSLPGGRQEIGETVFEAGRREASEETGLDVEILGIVDVVDSITRDPADRVRYHYTLVDLLAHAPHGEAMALDDVAEVAWHPVNAIDRLGLWSETVRVVRLAHEMWSALAAGGQLADDAAGDPRCLGAP
jgi:8-oxo-dGTP diphosphatase